jgi:glucokinase
MAKEPVVIGVDLGGTNVRLALVTHKGEILARKERATASLPDQETLVATLGADLLALKDMALGLGVEVKGGGLGLPGRVLPKEGRVAFSPNVPALNDCRLAARLKPLVPFPLALENDANLFALGEHWLGAGAGHPHMLGITLGTGVGGGLILDGKLWSGPTGTSAEVGHITVDPEGIQCRCGNRGCLETVASASWAVWWVKKQLAQGADSWLRELYEKDADSLGGEALEVAARHGDALAYRAFERVGRSLGQAIATVIHILGVPHVVIGGKFARAWDVFQKPLKEELKERLTLFPLSDVTLTPARLGDDAGLLGAARLAWVAI